MNMVNIRNDIIVSFLSSFVHEGEGAYVNCLKHIQPAFYTYHYLLMHYLAGYLY